MNGISALGVHRVDLVSKCGPKPASTWAHYARPRVSERDQENFLFQVTLPRGGSSGLKAARVESPMELLMNTLPPATQTPNPIFSRRRVGVAGAAALLGCVACCAAPLLAVLGLSGGAAAALTSVFRPGSELLVGGGIFVLVLSAMAVRQRFGRKTSGACGSVCSVDAQCCDRRSLTSSDSPNVGTRPPSSRRG